MASTLTVRVGRRLKRRLRRTDRHLRQLSFIAGTTICLLVGAATLALSYYLGSVF